MSKEESIGAVGAAMQGVKAVAAPGLSLGKIPPDVGAEMGRMGVQGQAELASALFSDGNAYVPYGRGQNPAEQESVEPRKEGEPEIDRGGREDVTTRMAGIYGSDPQ